jgi:hypothetical protein
MFAVSIAGLCMPSFVTAACRVALKTRRAQATCAIVGAYGVFQVGSVQIQHDASTPLCRAVMSVSARQADAWVLTY